MCPRQEREGRGGVLGTVAGSEKLWVSSGSAVSGSKRPWSGGFPPQTLANAAHRAAVLVFESGLTRAPSCPEFPRRAASRGRESSCGRGAGVAGGPDVSQPAGPVGKGGVSAGCPTGAGGTWLSAVDATRGTVTQPLSRSRSMASLAF